MCCLCWTSPPASTVMTLRFLCTLRSMNDCWSTPLSSRVFSLLYSSLLLCFSVTLPAPESSTLPFALHGSTCTAANQLDGRKIKELLLFIREDYFNNIPAIVREFTLILFVFSWTCTGSGYIHTHKRPFILICSCFFSGIDEEYVLLFDPIACRLTTPTIYLNSQEFAGICSFVDYFFLNSQLLRTHHRCLCSPHLQIQIHIMSLHVSTAFMERFYVM